MRKETGKKEEKRRDKEREDERGFTSERGGVHISSVGSLLQ